MSNMDIDSLLKDDYDEGPMLLSDSKGKDPGQGSDEGGAGD